MNKITFKILLLVMIKFDFLAKIVNIETAFPYGELEEEMYMECNMSKNDYIILKKWIFGLVQSVLQHKKAVEIFKKVGFNRDNIDPCLYMEKIKGYCMYSFCVKMII